MGPTASGKTGVAVELVRTMPVEIISVDSALVYRDMNIGTAKPDAATLARAPHHLIDIIDPTEAYSAAAFRHDAGFPIPQNAKSFLLRASASPNPSLHTPCTDSSSVRA